MPDTKPTHTATPTLTRYRLLCPICGLDGQAWTTEDVLLTCPTCGGVDLYGYLAAAVDALLAARAPSAEPWQPISSAPTDEPVLTYRGAGLMAVAEHIAHPAYWPKKDRRVWCCTDGVELLNVTHWMPLPPPPRAEKTDDDDSTRVDSQ